jgi:hypothetical protein
VIRTHTLEELKAIRGGDILPGTEVMIHFVPEGWNGNPQPVHEPGRGICIARFPGEYTPDGIRDVATVMWSVVPRNAHGPYIFMPYAPWEENPQVRLNEEDFKR